MKFSKLYFVLVSLYCVSRYAVAVPVEGDESSLSAPEQVSPSGKQHQIPEVQEKKGVMNNENKVEIQNEKKNRVQNVNKDEPQNEKKDEPQNENKVEPQNENKDEPQNEKKDEPQ
ncbi:hypothetical protein AYI70_g884, partial [Smittium culicis]